MNILITGAFGFVGTNLSKALAKSNKHRLIALDLLHLVTQRPPDEYYPDYSQFVSWDELHTLNNKNIDAVIHLAGKAHDTRNTAAEQEYFDINLGLTQKIVEFFLQSGVKKFIFFSSVKAVADTVPGEYLTEETTPLPGTPYGKSKLEAERFLSRNFGIGMTAQKKVYILRPCMIHGPGNKGNLNLLYKLVSKGIPWPLGAYQNQRSFTSIANLNFVISQLLEKEIKPGTYNVADDEPLSTNRLIELIAQSCGKKARIWQFSPKQVSRLARVCDKMQLLLTSERLKKLTESYVVSNTKLKKALGIKNLPVSAEEGMRNTLQSFKK